MMKKEQIKGEESGSMIVGITGPTGAGKGLAVRQFAAHGFAVIDADAVAREVVRPGEPTLAALAEVFGSDIVAEDGSLRRRLLAKRAFVSREATDRMNAIMHTEICRRMIHRAREYADRGESCLFDAPLLFEAGLEKVCDCCVAVIAPREERIRRLKERDGLTEEEILSRIGRQHEDDFYTSRCAYTIVNDSDPSEMAARTEDIIRRILSHQGKEL